MTRLLDLRRTQGGLEKEAPWLAPASEVSADTQETSCSPVVICTSTGSQQQGIGLTIENYSL